MSDHKESSLTFYIGIWLTLLAGTALTVVAARIDLGQFNAAVALTIATVKALLVALFFMHIKGAHEKLLKLVVISTVFFLFILIAFSLSDYGTRTWSEKRIRDSRPRLSAGAARYTSKVRSGSSVRFWTPPADIGQWRSLSPPISPAKL